jgi:hypothetical protein
MLKARGGALQVLARPLEPSPVSQGEAYTETDE